MTTTEINKKSARKPMHKVGRPRSGTEEERLQLLLSHSLAIFKRDGYAQASIAKIASAAGVSTRTIYERYQNKANLMVAAISRMLDHDMKYHLDLKNFEGMQLQNVLLKFGMIVLKRATSDDVLPIYRMCLAEAYRFPELGTKMEAAIPSRIEALICQILKTYGNEFSPPLTSYTNKTARLFLDMIVTTPRHQVMFGLDRMSESDAEKHVKQVVDIYLHGIQGQASSANTKVINTEDRGNDEH